MPSTEKGSAIGKTSSFAGIVYCGAGFIWKIGGFDELDDDAWGSAGRSFALLTIDFERLKMFICPTKEEKRERERKGRKQGVSMTTGGGTGSLPSGEQGTVDTQSKSVNPRGNFPTC